MTTHERINLNAYGYPHDDTLSQTELTGSEKRATNIYGRVKFPQELAKQHVEMMSAEFRTYYASLGYIEHTPVLISSGVDPTVRFVGSHISVFKPYLINQSVPSSGYFMVQDCVRTKNLDYVFDDSYLPRWGSHFLSLGAITQPKQFGKTCEEAFRFFEEKLKIPQEYIRARLNSNDTDFLQACGNHYKSSNIEADTKPIEYYRHKIGTEDIWGRSFNIALRDATSNTFSDVGNIIILERVGEPLGVEVALGSTTILKQLYNLDHVLDCYSVIGLQVDSTSIKRKFEDAIVVSMILNREGLKPTASGNRERLLRSYMRSLSYFRAKTNITLEELFKILSTFEFREFPNSQKYVSGDIINYLREFENNLMRKKDYSSEEKKILLALRTIK